jgi:hypothetical protein
VIRNPSQAATGEVKSVILRSKVLAPVVLFALSFFAQSSLGQNSPAPAQSRRTPTVATATPTPTPTPKERKTSLVAPANGKETKALNAETVAESAIFVYGSGGGRAVLNQIRKTAIERGKISITNPEGRIDQATYQRWTQRADTLSKEKVRLDQEFSNARYSLVFNEEKIFGIVDDSVFTPREDASKAFENQILHGLEALLRYKENESKLELVGKEKILGVEYHVLDVIDKQSRRTRFYISARQFRVMMLDYEFNGVKYRRRFYDYNYAQGTLVPFRTTLWAGEKLVEETEVGTITFGQKIDENLFSAGSAG